MIRNLHPAVISKLYLKLIRKVLSSINFALLFKCRLEHFGCSTLNLRLMFPDEIFLFNFKSQLFYFLVQVV